MDTIKFQVRQGDVLLVRIGDKKPNGNPVVRDRIVLAEGEVTGHAHVVEGAVAEFNINGSRVLWVEAPTTISHQEHDFKKTHGVGILPVEPGVYEIIQQWDEWTSNNVAD